MHHPGAGRMAGRKVETTAEAADLVETPDGWWVTFLGFRPQGGKFHHLGRETFLAPVTWENGWPVVNSNQPITASMTAPKLTPHPWPQESERDEFDSADFRLDWTFLRNPHEQDCSLAALPGSLRLYGSAVTLNDKDSPTFVARRQTDLNCRAATKLSFSPQHTNEEAGLVLRGNDNNHCEVGVTFHDGKRQVFFRKVLDGKILKPVTFAELPSGDVILSVKAQTFSYEFFYQASDGKEASLGTARTRDLSTETLTAQKNASFNFTGVFIGMYATGNGTRCSTPADFDWFEYQPNPPATRSTNSPSAVNNAATQSDHKQMLDLLGIKSIRRGRDGSNPKSPNYANYDESKANPFPNLPDPLMLKNGEKI